MALWCNGSALLLFVLLRSRLPASRLIGQLSYGGFFLYLFHRPIYVVLLKVSGPLTPMGRELLLLVIGLPLAIVFGIAAQRAYDALVGWIERQGSRSKLALMRSPQTGQ